VAVLPYVEGMGYAVGVVHVGEGGLEAEEEVGEGTTIKMTLTNPAM